MKKRITFLTLILAMTLMLSGCFKLEAGVSINPDGSGEIYSKALASEDFEGDLNDEEVFEFDGNATKTFIEETHDNIKYTGELQKQPFNSLGELKEFFNEEMEIEVDGNVVTLIIKNDTSEQSEEDIEMNNMMKMTGVTTDFKITVPELIETNGSAKGNTATWDLITMQGDLIVKYKTDVEPVIPEDPVTPVDPGKQAVKVELNGELLVFLDQGPIIVDNRTLVPIRTISEELGMNVEWDNATRTAIISKDNKSIYVAIGQNDVVMKYPINGNPDNLASETIVLDVPAQIVNSRTMVPLRAISELFDIQVDWDAGSYTAILKN